MTKFRCAATDLRFQSAMTSSVFIRIFYEKQNRNFKFLMTYIPTSKTHLTSEDLKNVLENKDLLFLKATLLDLKLI